MVGNPHPDAATVQQTGSCDPGITDGLRRRSQRGPLVQDPLIDFGLREQELQSLYVGIIFRAARSYTLRCFRRSKLATSSCQNSDNEVNPHVQTATYTIAFGH